MICSRCGAQVPDNTKFCPNCGEDLSLGKKVQDAATTAFERTESEMGSAFSEMRDTFNGTVRQHLKDDRGLLSYILLSIITCGIYSYYFIYKLAKDVNVACEGDGERTQGLVAFILLSVVTCGIYSWIWYYGLGNRLASNAPRYGMSFQENGTTVLMWLIFGSLLCGIGPFIAMNILIKNSNKICNAYNRKYGF